VKPLFLLVILALSANVVAQLPGNPAAEQITKLRLQREKAIAESIAKANAEYSANLDKLKSLYSSNPETAELVAREKAELEKIGMAPVPPSLKITTELKGAAKVPRKRPVITRDEDLTRYLIGTRWNYYNNDKFAGTAQILEFTGPGKATLNGKETEWKVIEKDRIWFVGNREFVFNKGFDEFLGGWVPNPKDRNSARLIP
jgi:hypothetical protein